MGMSMITVLIKSPDIISCFRARGLRSGVSSVATSGITTTEY